MISVRIKPKVAYDFDSYPLPKMTMWKWLKDPLGRVESHEIKINWNENFKLK